MGLGIAGVGSALSLIGLIWIIVIAFQNGDIIWGVISIFCGIVGLVYGIMHMEEARIPVMLMVIGLALSIVGQLMGGFAAVG